MASCGRRRSPVRNLPCALLIIAILCLALIPRTLCDNRRWLQEEGGDMEGGAEDAIPAADEGSKSGGDGSKEAAPEDSTGGDAAPEGEGSDQPTTGEEKSGETSTEGEAKSESSTSLGSNAPAEETVETPTEAQENADSADASVKEGSAADEPSAEGAAGEEQKDGGEEGQVMPKKKRGGKGKRGGRRKKGGDVPVEEGIAKTDSASDEGATNEGAAADKAVSEASTSEEGAQGEGSPEEGAAGEGATDAGAKSKSTAGEGAKDEEGAEEGGKSKEPTEGDGGKSETTAEESDSSESDSNKETSAAGKGESGAPAEESPKEIEPKGDIDPKGPCKADIKRHCQGATQPMLDCLTFHAKNEKAGNEVGGIPISAKCKADIRAFRAAMYKDLTLDADMEMACKRDIIKYCDDDFLYPEPGNVLACLRELKDSQPVSDQCKAKVFKREQAAAEDFKLDPQLNEQCSADAERLCKGVEPGGGRVQECLRSQRDKLQWDCQAELFRQEQEDAGDIRLNVRLFQACRNDQLKFCADVKFGGSRVKECLEQHRLDADFSARCKTEFDKMMLARATDFRLDPLLRQACKDDIAKICYADEQEMNDVASPDARVVECLQDYREELTNPQCKKRVHILTARAAEDMRFDRPLSQACYDDRQKLCRDIPDGMAQVFMCLQEKMGELQLQCRRAIFHQLVRFAEDIDFKFPVKRACSTEMSKLCKQVPQGHAARVKCLQQSLDSPDMGEECKKEVMKDMARSAEDYRLNYRLHKSCLPEIRRLCPRVCEAEKNNGSLCGGSVLKCLQERREEISVVECKEELMAFTQVEAKDPLAFDVPLVKACAADLKSLCPNERRDHSRQLACLRAQHDKLSETCKAEELRFSAMEATDIRLTPSLMNACGEELQTYCRAASPTDGKAFSCLQEHLQEVGFSAACQGEVNLQAAREASDYRLDVRVVKECVDDIERLCSDVDKGVEGHAVVLKCMVKQFSSLVSPCQSEVAYAVRMALFQYELGADLTNACDPAVNQSCGSADGAAIDGAVIGKFGQCLLSLPGAQLPGDCQVLVEVAATEGAHAGGITDEAKVKETLERLKELQAQLASGGGGGGFVISGWIAAISVVALLAMLAAVGYGVYYFYINPRRNYTLVVKQAPPAGA